MYKDTNNNEYSVAILIAVVLLPFFPYTVGLIAPEINTLMLLCKIAVIIFGIHLFFDKLIKKNLLSKFHLSLIFFLLVILISTLINRGDLNSFVMKSAYILIPPIIISYYFENHRKEVIKGIYLLFTTLVVTNFILMIVFPSGIFNELTATGLIRYHLLGYKNQMSGVLLSSIAVFLWHSEYFYSRITLGCVIRVCIAVLSVIIGNSSTAIMGVVFFLLFYLLINYNKKLTNIKVQLAIVIFVFFAFVFFRIQEVFSYLIVGYLGKDLTFSNRIFIWDNAIQMIINNPIFGYGVQSTDNVVHIDMGYAERYMITHNYFLDIALKGGILGFLLFANIIRIVSKTLIKYKSVKGVLYLGTGVSVYLFMSTMDVFLADSSLFILLCIISESGTFNTTKANG